jgi:N-acylneuraminate cytidylyltransferase
MKVIAVIPARGGSKRIPKKNIIDFMGKPMIAWTIQAAYESKIFDRVIVSTDDNEFAAISNQYGCDVPFLRDSSSDDITPVSLATIRAVEQAEKFYNEEYDIVVQLMANTPLRTANDIVQHFNNFLEQKIHFQISSFKFGWMNPWWSFKPLSNGGHEWMLPDGISKRSQDLPNLYCPTGAIWIANKQMLLKEQTFYGDGFKFYEIDWKSAADIDDYDDLEFTKAIYHLLNTDNL